MVARPLECDLDEEKVYLKMGFHLTVLHYESAKRSYISINTAIIFKNKLIIFEFLTNELR